MVDLLSPFTGSAYTAAADAQKAAINAGLSAAIPQYQAGRLYSDTLINPAYSYWNTNTDAATKGLNAYTDATGGGGAAGTQRALDTFFQSPDYLSRLKSGNNAILAQQAATGGTGSGTELKALADYNQSLAGQGYSDYTKNLAAFLPFSTQNVSGLSSTLSNQAALGLPQFNKIGDAQYGAATSIGNANANAALGQNTAAQNVWNLGSNLLGGILGGGGGSKLASGITSLFGA